MRTSRGMVSQTDFFSRVMTKLALTSLTVFGALTVIGCRNIVPPNSQISKVKDMAPGRWTATKEAKGGVDHAWVRRFGDSKLTRLVDQALAANYDLRGSAENVIQAQQSAVIAGVPARPTADFRYDGRRSETAFIGFPFGGSQISDNFGTSLDINWEPDVWGVIAAGQSAALAEIEVQSAQYRAARASLAAQICKAWFLLAESEMQVGLSNDALTIRKETEVAIKERFERSLGEEGGSASQLRLAQTDIATTKAELSQRKGQAEAARRQLELLTGKYPSAKIPGVSVLPRLPKKPPVGLPSELLLRRPDIIAAERNYAASMKRVEQTKLAVYPSFKLTGSAGTVSDSLSDLLDSNFGVWSLGKSVVQPILTGGRIKAEARSRRSVERQRLAQLQSTTLKAFGEVENALASDRWLAKRISELGEALKLAKEAATAADEDYRGGTGDILTVLSAKNQQITIASQLLTLRRLQLENRVDLHLALGGGFTVKGK